MCGSWRAKYCICETRRFYFANFERRVETIQKADGKLEYIQSEFSCCFLANCTVSHAQLHHVLFRLKYLQFYEKLALKYRLRLTNDHVLFLKAQCMYFYNKGTPFTIKGGLLSQQSNLHNTQPFKIEIIKSKTYGQAQLR